ncbi:MAG TPA: S53 family peptidase [Candidatus Baltobacteraceae bacterium]|nr:S53 family peptidase [Candidatus Baltobacteraceae bacterium]
MSILAACSGGGGLTPQAPLRSIEGAVTASNGGQYDYDANPPTQPFDSTTDYTTNALPPPSLCVRVYGLTCYTASEIRKAYNVPSSYDGSGQTIVVIDAFGSPTIQQDLAYFNAVMGLPGTTLNVSYPTGQPAAFDPSSALRIGWAGETSLDVEWAHAIAPKATIDLVVAPTSRSSDMHAAQDYAVHNHLGNVISMSYGSSEIAIPGGATNKYLQHSDSTLQQAKDAGITVVASAGDYGAGNGTQTLRPEYPASNPLVLSVGGTSLLMSDAGVYQSESVWNDSSSSQCPLGCQLGLLAGATGGAPSSLFKAPSYQQSLSHTASRETADVSYNAGVYTAVLVAQSFRNPGHYGLYFVGGTSSGAPQWAGIIALANQAAGHPLGYVNQALYTIGKSASYNSVFHDVTTGSNGLLGGPSEAAGTGYDMPTGLGSPNVANLIPALIRASNT